jgi:hypothetical protein
MLCFVRHVLTSGLGVGILVLTGSVMMCQFTDSPSHRGLSSINATIATITLKLYPV